MCVFNMWNLSLGIFWSFILSFSSMRFSYLSWINGIFFQRRTCNCYYVLHINVTLFYDLELLVKELEVIVDNVEALSELPGVKWICSVSVPCRSSCTSFLFVSLCYLEVSFRPTGTSVPLAFILLIIMNFLY